MAPNKFKILDLNICDFIGALNQYARARGDKPTTPSVVGVRFILIL